jgi:uncharacterized membrane protein YfcA
MTLSLLLAVLGAAAGYFGALVGVGGGLLLIPGLVLLFRLDMPTAVATSLVGVIASSTAAGSAYVGKGLTNMRLGMTLEISTTVGGLTGALLGTRLHGEVLAGVFAVLVFVTAGALLRPGKREHEAAVEGAHADARGTGWEESGGLGGGYVEPRTGETVRYRASRIPLGSAIALTAGVLSGLLGVGGGALKVPAMNLGMRIPMRVAAATSNFMVGVTAVSSLLVYFARGHVHPAIAAPTALGVAAGALLGARMSGRFRPSVLRRVLAVALLLLGVEMAAHALGVNLGT